MDANVCNSLCTRSIDNIVLKIHKRELLFYLSPHGTEFAFRGFNLLSVTGLEVYVTTLPTDFYHILSKLINTSNIFQTLLVASAGTIGGGVLRPLLKLSHHEQSN